MLGEVEIDLHDLLKAAFQHRERNRFLQVGQPFRLAAGVIKGFKHTFEIKKDGVKQGEVDLSIGVVDKVVAMLKPAAEAREEPNNHPALPDPLRKMPWDDNATVVTTGACACLGGGGAPVDNGNMAAE